jgi:hypothetical protein
MIVADGGSPQQRSVGLKPFVVDGVIIAEGRTAMERAFACAMDSPFGGVGFYWVYAERRPASAPSGDVRPALEAQGSSVKLSGFPHYDFGAFRPEAFSRVGLFDESLRRNQDDEFNLRVRLAGGGVVPSLPCPPSLRSRLRQCSPAPGAGCSLSSLVLVVRWP